MSGSSAKEKLEKLSGEQAELLKLLREQKVRRRQAVKVYPRPQGSEHIRMPTSWAQQRIWFIDQLEGHSTAYNFAFALRFRGQLVYHTLRQALDAVVYRHEVLRTVFITMEGELKQEISRQGCFALDIVDLTAYTDSQLEAQVVQQKSAEAQAMFDLRLGPLIRGRLLQLSGLEHVLLVTVHHIVFDGWSKHLFIRELILAYERFGNGLSGALPPPLIQYADYAQWQREWFQGKTLDKQLEYWSDRLKGAAPQLELPTDYPRPAVQSYRGGSIEIVMDSQLSSQLRAFAQQCEMTVFMVLHAGLAIVLAELSGQEDILIGTSVANRQRPELEGLIGCFANTVVLRTQVQRDLELKRFLQHVKEVTLGAYEYQDVPFEQIVEALKPKRTLDRNPLFQVALVLLNIPHSEPSLPELTVKLEESGYESAQFDLELVFQERGNQLVGRIYYAADIFEQRTVERWINCLVGSLGAITDGAQGRIADLCILPEAQRREVLDLFNAPQMVYPQEKLIHQLFEEQAHSRPQAVAVVCEGMSLTYALLNQRASQLARYLKDKGVGPDQLVAICVERSLDMVVGLLGILKAGGAYVPLDPNYPRERLHHMLEDAGPRVLLTQERLRSALPAGQADIVTLDGNWNEIAQQPTHDLVTLGFRSDQLAYVIYTSGSTGKPKGVMIEHQNVTRLFAATAQWFDFNERDVWTLFHSFAFDFSVWELWGALLYGGRVVVVPYLTACSPQVFYRLVCDEEVTVLNQTPSAFAQLVDAQSYREQQHSLRVVIFGGEALDLNMLRPWVERNGVERPQLVNMYGITETTVHVTYRSPLRREEIESGRGSPIGKPIPDLRAYLLNQYGHPVPIGVAGEMYIAGAGVARGYLNRPELTGQRFLADPFSVNPQARMYKTGDLGRWRADGTLEYLGRNDHQVKIRGFRIELGEIEAQLVRHPQVKEALVVAREDIAGEKRLVGYVIAKDLSAPEGVSAKSLRTHLRAVLPEHMIPSAFMLLERWPLTPNGKLDRRALPSPDMTADVSHCNEPPMGEVEQALAKIWQELLHLDRVGRDSDFFDLGGHSLLAMQVAARVYSSLSVDMPIRLVFEFPKLKDLSAQLGSLRGAKLYDAMVAGGPDVEKLLAEVVSMPEEQVEELLQKFSAEKHI